MQFYFLFFVYYQVFFPINITSTLVSSQELDTYRYKDRDKLLATFNKMSVVIISIKISLSCFDFIIIHGMNTWKNKSPTKKMQSLESIELCNAISVESSCEWKSLGNYSHSCLSWSESCSNSKSDQILVEKSLIMYLIQARTLHWSILFRYLIMIFLKSRSFINTLQCKQFSKCVSFGDLY